MTNQPRQTVARKIENIAHKLSIGYTDREIMHEMKMPPRTYYEYKHRVAQTYQDMARLDASQELLSYEADLLVERLTRTYRNLEIAVSNAEETSEKTDGSDVLAAIALTIFKVRAETFKVRQTRGIRELEIKAGRYIEDFQSGRQQLQVSNISRVDESRSTINPGTDSPVTSTGEQQADRED